MATLTAAYRWSVAARVAAAVIGGYALTSALTVFFALIWPTTKADALAASTMLSFTVYTGIVIWVFAESSIKRIWAVLVGATALVAGASWLLMGVRTWS